MSTVYNKRAQLAYKQRQIQQIQDLLFWMLPLEGVLANVLYKVHSNLHCQL